MLNKIVRASLIIGTLLAVSAGYSIAHDFWTQPSRFTMASGQPVNVRLFVGHGDDLHELPHMSDHAYRFEAHGPDGVSAVKGRARRVPAGQVRLAQQGIYTLLYQSNHSYVELEPGKFEAYLREEGLTGIIAERKRRGETSKKGKESYARYTKALVRVDGATDGYDRKLDLPLELTALDNPFTRRKGQTIRFVLERYGKPLPGMTVELISLDNLDRKRTATTDAKGRVSFQVPGPGAWMAATTWMRRVPANANIKGDWESFWATTSFEVAGK